MQTSGDSYLYYSSPVVWFNHVIPSEIVEYTTCFLDLSSLLQFELTQKKHYSLTAWNWKQRRIQAGFTEWSTSVDKANPEKWNCITEKTLRKFLALKNAKLMDTKAKNAAIEELNSPIQLLESVGSYIKPKRSLNESEELDQREEISSFGGDLFLQGLIYLRCAEKAEEGKQTKFINDAKKALQSSVEKGCFLACEYLMSQESLFSSGKGTIELQKKLTLECAKKGYFKPLHLFIQKCISQPNSNNSESTLTEAWQELNLISQSHSLPPIILHQLASLSQANPKASKSAQKILEQYGAKVPLHALKLYVACQIKDSQLDHRNFDSLLIQECRLLIKKYGVKVSFDVLEYAARAAFDSFDYEKAVELYTLIFRACKEKLAAVPFFLSQMAAISYWMVGESEKALELANSLKRSQIEDEFDCNQTFNSYVNQSKFNNYFKQKQKVPGEKIIEKAIEYFKKKDYQKALNLYRCAFKAFKQEKKGIPEVDIERAAHCFFHLNHYSEALELYNQIVVANEEKNKHKGSIPLPVLLQVAHSHFILKNYSL
jgi:hypothetical protein